MITVDADYLTKEADPNHHYNVYAYIYRSATPSDYAVYDSSKLLDVSIISGIGANEGLSFGGCYCKELDISVIIDNAADEPPRGGRIKIVQTVENGSGVESLVSYPMGTFYIDSREKDEVNNVYTFRCYDAMAQLEVADSKIESVRDPLLYSKKVCTNYLTSYGVGWANDNDSLLTGATAIPEWYFTNKEHTVRETLGAIALSVGASWVIDSDSKLRLIYQGPSSGWAPSNSIVQTFTRGDLAQIQSLTLIGDNGTYGDGDPTVSGFHIKQNLTYADQALATSCYALIAGDAYIPYNITYAEIPPYIEAGDTIALAVGGNTYNVPIYSMRRYCDSAMYADISLAVNQGSSHEFLLPSNYYI